MRNWKNCNRCKGTGRSTRFAKLPSGEYGDVPAPCMQCYAFGMLPAPDFGEILSDITVTRGKRKGCIQKSFPGSKLNRWSKQWDVRTRAHRAYYVWRMYQFHSGVDVRMPVSAEWGYDDPYKTELDLFARILVHRLHGHASAGVARWRGAFYGEHAPRGMPWSAYSGGPEVLR